MKRQCAWCLESLPASEKAANDSVITHGICTSCALRLTSGYTRTARDMLDMIQEPVLVMDSDHVLLRIDDVKQQDHIEMPVPESMAEGKAGNDRN